MSTIPTSVTEEQFEQYIRPYLRTAQRGYECKIALYKVFNYILRHLPTGCQWKQLPVAHCANDQAKKRSVGRRSTTPSRNRVPTVVCNGCGKPVSRRSTLDLSQLNLDGSYVIAFAMINLRHLFAAIV